MARIKRKAFEVTVRLTVAADTYETAMEIVEETLSDLRILEQDGIQDYQLIDDENTDLHPEEVDYDDYYREEDYEEDY
jgi:hypothetical protein